MVIKNILALCFVFFLSSCFSHAFMLDADLLKIGKNVPIKNKLLRFWCFFPFSLFTKTKKLKTKVKHDCANLFGILLQSLNMIILFSGIAFMFLPEFPCEEIEISFGPRHRYLDFVADTYNEKVPLLSIWIILFTQLLIILIRCLVAVFAKKGTEKKAKIGTPIVLLVIILINIFVLVYFCKLLFQ